LLRLGAIATLGPYYLPSLLREVRAAFPQLELRLEEGRTVGLLGALQAGDLDAVLLALPVGADGLMTAPLFFEPFLAAFPADHPLAEQSVLTAADLASEGLLLLEEGHCLRDQALALCGAAGARQGSRLASSLEMLRHMVAAGEGFTLLPLLSTRGRADLDGLVRHRELEGGAVGRSIGLVWRATDPRSTAFRRLARFLAGTAPAGTRSVGEPEAPNGSS
jgi:LysR family hydrogen peroxide-inducible transcriptional activator